LNPKLLRRPRQKACGSDPQARWWLRTTTFLVITYVVTSQTLLNFPGWSVAGFAIAVVLVVLLIFGRLFGICRFAGGRWLLLPATFVCYCVLRGLLGSKYSEPGEVLSAVASAYVGGIGVAAALQAGVSFRALAYAQIVSSLCQMVGVLYGMGEIEGRSAGLTGNANEFGLQLTLGACMIWLVPKQSGFWGCLLAVGCMAGALITSGSRQALLVVPFFLALVLVAVFSTIKGRRRLVVAGALVGLCVIGLSLTPLILEHARDITAIQRAIEYDSDSSYHKRISMIQSGFNRWQEAPLLGNGVDAFRNLSGMGTYAHNDYIELLCDLGLLGTLLFYAIHANILIAAGRLPKSLQLCCWIFVLLLFSIDTGSVGYKRKQTIMLLMILGSIASRPYLNASQGEWRSARREFGPKRVSRRPQLLSPDLGRHCHLELEHQGKARSPRE
jgi:O-antigen ligase